MTVEHFQKMVARLEQLARRKPGSYRFRVFLLAITGFGYYGIVLLISLILSLGLILIVIGGLLSGHFPVAAIKVIVVFGIFIFSMSYYMIRALFVKIEPPEGIELTQENAPKLFKVLDELRKQLELPHLKKVLLTGEYNASVVQVPKYFLIGPTDRYLMLGFPLMDTLTEKQLKSVLGHELGHLSGNHAAFSNWIYRLRSTFGRLYSMLEAGQRSDIFLRWFTKKYVPYFDAYTFVLARDNEYEADAVAARVASPEDAAQALVNIHAVSRQLDNKIWPAVYKNVSTQSVPPTELMADLRTYWTKFDEETANACLEQDFRQTNSPYQTHPPLSARLKSLGFTADKPADIMSLFSLPNTGEPPSAIVYLGDHYRELEEQVNGRWRKAMQDSWSTEYASMEKLRQKLQINETQSDADFETLLERSQLYLKLNATDKAESLLAELLQPHPQHPILNFSMGWVLLDREDEAGLAYMYKIDNAASPELLNAAAETTCNFLIANGREDDAKQFNLKMMELFDEVSLIHGKRKEITKETLLIPHELSHDKLDTLTNQLLESPLIKTAWLVRKQIEGDPVYVLLLERKKAFVEISEEGAINAFIRSLNIELPGDGVLALLYKQNKWLLKRMKKVPNSVIFVRK